MEISPCLLATSSSAPLRGMGRGGWIYKKGVMGREQAEAKDIVNIIPSWSPMGKIWVDIRQNSGEKWVVQRIQQANISHLWERESLGKEMSHACPNPSSLSLLVFRFGEQEKKLEDLDKWRSYQWYQPFSAWHNFLRERLPTIATLFHHSNYFLILFCFLGKQKQDKGEGKMMLPLQFCHMRLDGIQMIPKPLNSQQEHLGRRVGAL